MKLILLGLIGLTALVSSQSQCNPNEYDTCGNFIRQLGYTKTCDTKTSCRDCVGCNQACPWIGACNTMPGCTVNDYIQAGNIIKQKKNSLGWLNLCCENQYPQYAKCVGCQHANIFGILCDWVYPPLKQTLIWQGVQFAKSENNENIDADWAKKENFPIYAKQESFPIYAKQPLSVRNDLLNGDNKYLLLFGMELFGLGLIAALVLLTFIIGLICCLCHKRSRIAQTYKKIIPYDSTTDQDSESGLIN